MSDIKVIIYGAAPRSSMIVAVQLFHGRLLPKWKQKRWQDRVSDHIRFKIRKLNISSFQTSAVWLRESDYSFVRYYVITIGEPNEMLDRIDATYFERNAPRRRELGRYVPSCEVANRNYAIASRPVNVRLQQTHNRSDVANPQSGSAG